MTESITIKPPRKRTRRELVAQIEHGFGVLAFMTAQMQGQASHRPIPALPLEILGKKIAFYQARFAELRDMEIKD